MRHLTAADYIRTPWKNGGGETVQLAISPEGAGLDDFDWRVSMATIDRDGAFSVFAGIDRSLAIISGAGVTLDTDGVRHELTLESPPLCFAGETKTYAALVSGPVVDFNVMSRRGRATHALAPMSVGENHDAQSEFAAIFAVTAARLYGGDELFDLAPGELLVLDPGTSVTLDAGTAFKLRCWQCSQTKDDFCPAKPD